jgi:anti-anti-sigma factor
MGFLEILESFNSSHRGSPVELRERDERLLKLALRGELDMKASSDLTPLLDSAVLECPPKGRLVLDLSLVNYISSTGVGLLSSILVKAEKRSVSLVHGRAGQGQEHHGHPGPPLVFHGGGQLP